MFLPISFKNLHNTNEGSINYVHIKTRSTVPQKKNKTKKKQDDNTYDVKKDEEDKITR